MAADYPSAYRGHPAMETLVAIPTTWDETHVLDAAVGQSVVIARRHGDDWWIGAMTDRQPRTLSIPLTFLGDGRFRADWWQDDAAATPPMARKTQEATSSDELNVKLAPCGGTLIHVVPIR
jgi:alpha-glucosidase